VIMNSELGVMWKAQDFAFVRPGGITLGTACCLRTHDAFGVDSIRLHTIYQMTCVNTEKKLSR
jgi:hypothetical protein